MWIMLSHPNNKSSPLPWNLLISESLQGILVDNLWSFMPDNCRWIIIFAKHMKFQLRVHFPWEYQQLIQRLSEHLKQNGRHFLHLPLPSIKHPSNKTHTNHLLLFPTDRHTHACRHRETGRCWISPYILKMLPQL